MHSKRLVVAMNLVLLSIHVFFCLLYKGNSLFTSHRRSFLCSKYFNILRKKKTRMSYADVAQELFEARYPGKGWIGRLVMHEQISSVFLGTLRKVLFTKAIFPLRASLK